MSKRTTSGKSSKGVISPPPLAPPPGPTIVEKPITLTKRAWGERNPSPPPPSEGPPKMIDLPSKEELLRQAVEQKERELQEKRERDAIAFAVRVKYAEEARALVRNTQRKQRERAIRNTSSVTMLEASDTHPSEEEVLVEDGTMPQGLAYLLGAGTVHGLVGRRTKVMTVPRPPNTTNYTDTFTFQVA